MKDWRDVLREQGIPLLKVYQDVRHDILMDEAKEHADLYGIENLTDDDYEKIVSAFESNYCEHEIASNVWADVFAEYRED